LIEQSNQDVALPESSTSLPQWPISCSFQPSSPAHRRCGERGIRLGEEASRRVRSLCAALTIDLAMSKEEAEAKEQEAATATAELLGKKRVA
jgi:hypothetical protein